jgi:hypothetical protein
MVGGGFLIFLPWRPVLRFQRPLRGRIPNHRIRLGEPKTNKGLSAEQKASGTNRIHMLGLPDPDLDQFVRNMDPGPDPESGSLYH